MIPKKVTFLCFFFSPHKSTDLWSLLDWGSDPSEHSLGFLCDLIKMMYQLQATIFWIIAQVSPFKGVIISKAIQFWKTAFLIRDISVFSKDRFCQLSFKACWVNWVKASICATMSSRPMERKKTAAKWLYQWKTEHAHLALRWAALGTCPGRTHTHVVQGRQHCQPRDDGRGGRICQSRISTFPPFRGTCSFPEGLTCSKPIPKETEQLPLSQGWK